MALTKTKINLGTEGNLSGSRSLLGIENTLVSSSAQLATNISGSFTAASSSFSTRVARNEASASSLTSDSGSFSTRITQATASISAATSSISALKTDSGSFSSRTSTLEGSGTAQGTGTTNSPTFADGTYTSNLGVSGSLTVKGMVTAEEFHTEFVSASIVYKSGSTKFGDTSDDIHQFSGSLRVTGSGDHYFTDGNVGIGTTSPDYMFEVESTTADGTAKIHGATNAYLHLDKGAASRRAEIIFDTAGTPLWYLGTTDSDSSGVDGTEFAIGQTSGGANADLIIDSSGNVGIGTAAPTETLHVIGNIAAIAADGVRDNDWVGEFKNQETTDDRSYGVIIQAGSTATDKSFLVQDHDGANSHLTVRGDGNVGIGTAAPGAKLELGAYDDEIWFGGGTYKLNGSYMESNSSLHFYLDSNANDTASVFQIHDNVTQAAGGGEVFTVKEGNVGIGTASPDTTLHLADSTSGNSGYPALRLEMNDTTLSTGDFVGKIEWEHQDDAGAGVAANIAVVAEDVSGNVAMTFGNARDAATERMRITSSGHMNFRSSGDAVYYFGENRPGTNTLNINATADSVLQLMEAESVKVRLHSSGDSYLNGGNVGIGITNPSSLLHVEKSSDSAWLSYINNTHSGGYGLKVKAGSDLGDYAFVVENQNSGTHRFRIAGDGKATFSESATINNAGSSAPASLKVENTGSTGYTGADVRMMTHTSTLRGAGIYTHNTEADSEWFAGQYYGNWGKWALCYEALADFNESTAESPHEVFYVTTNGASYNDQNVWGSTSDERIKNSIVDANSQWDDIKSLKIKNYKKDKDGKDAPVHIGVIAQDLELSGMNGLVENELADEAQVKMYDRLEEGDSIKTVKYSILYMKAIKALQEAMIRIEALENA